MIYKNFAFATIHGSVNLPPGVNLLQVKNHCRRRWRCKGGVATPYLTSLPKVGKIGKNF